MDRKKFWLSIAILSAVGFALRWTGIYYVGIDYQECLSAWYAQLKETGGLQALLGFEGDYNLPYATALLALTYVPVEPIIAIKLFSVFFDYVCAGVLAAVVMTCCGKGSYGKGAVAYGLVICCPVAVMNSGYLAQSDGIYAAFAFLSFLCLLRDRPVKGMLAFGCAVAMKLQAVFAFPVLAVLYWTKRKFTMLHILWVPVMIQILCLPAIMAGCGADIALRVYKNMLGRYPSMYYYYPNVWTFFQGMPYYAFGKQAIGFTFVILFLFVLLVIKSGRKNDARDYLEYFVWTAMTCAVFLPCMHERYNYLAEMLLIALAVVRSDMRLPAVILCLASTQCYLQGFLDLPGVSPYLLAVCNIGVYLYLSLKCMGRLAADFRANALQRDGICEKTSRRAE